MGPLVSRLLPGSAGAGDGEFDWSRVRARLAVHGVVDKAIAKEIFIHPAGRANFVVCRKLTMAPITLRAKPEVGVAIVFDRATLMDGVVGRLCTKLNTAIEPGSATVKEHSYFTEPGLSSLAFSGGLGANSVLSVGPDHQLTSLDFNRCQKTMEVSGSMAKAVAKEVDILGGATVETLVCQVVNIGGPMPEGGTFVQNAVVFNKATIGNATISILYLHTQCELVLSEGAIVDEQVYLQEDQLMSTALDHLVDDDLQNTITGITGGGVSSEPPRIKMGIRRISTLNLQPQSGGDMGNRASGSSSAPLVRRSGSLRVADTSQSSRAASALPLIPRPSGSRPNAQLNRIRQTSVRQRPIVMARNGGNGASSGVVGRSQSVQAMNSDSRGGGGVLNGAGGGSQGDVLSGNGNGPRRSSAGPRVHNPTCHSPIPGTLNDPQGELEGGSEDEEGEGGEGVCCVCLDKPKSVVLLPCRHLCTCRECASLCSTCPICRGRVMDVFDVYVA